MPLIPHRLPRLLLTLCLALAGLAATPAHADNELVSSLNAVRALGCAGRPGVATPLKPNAQLAQAAKGLADGLKLPEAMARQDYRATRTNNLWLSGPQGARAVTDMVTANYCAPLTEPALVDIGVYQQGVQTWIVMAAPFAPVLPTQSGEVASQVLDLVNAARGQARICGDKPFGAVGPVKLNATLSTVAMGHAQDMAANSYFAHQARDGSMPADRATRGGYRWRAVGENIAAGQATPEAAVEGWIKSPPHCANLMGAQYAEMGLAFAVNKTSEAGIYWVQMFGTQR
jgi:uncharacterized protein YkwD